MTKTNMDYWREALRNLPPLYKKWFDEEKKYLRKIIPKDANILEVGCGDGRSMNDILPITKNLTVIDHDKIAVRQAKKRFVEYPSVRIILAEATSLPFYNSSFDFVICMGTFTNLANKKFKALSEMKRVVNKDGTIIVSGFAENALPERLKVYRTLKSPIKEIKDDGTVIFDKSLKDNVSEQFSKKQLILIFNKSKLKVKEIRKFGIGYVCQLSR